MTFAKYQRIGILSTAILAVTFFTTAPLAAMPFIRLGNCMCMYIGDQGIYIRNCKDMGNSCTTAAASQTASVWREMAPGVASSAVAEREFGPTATTANFISAGIQQIETCVTIADGTRTCVQTFTRSRRQPLPQSVPARPQPQQH